MSIAPIAGCSGGTSGNSRRMSGRARARARATSPASSATRRSPSQSAIAPASAEREGHRLRRPTPSRRRSARPSARSPRRPRRRRRRAPSRCAHAAGSGTPGPEGEFLVEGRVRRARPPCASRQLALRPRRARASRSPAAPSSAAAPRSRRRPPAGGARRRRGGAPRRAHGAAARRAGVVRPLPRRQEGRLHEVRLGRELRDGRTCSSGAARCLRANVGGNDVERRQEEERVYEARPGGRLVALRAACVRRRRRADRRRAPAPGRCKLEVTAADGKREQE